MASESGVLGLHILGSAKPGSLGYKPDLRFINLTNFNRINSRFCANEYYRNFDLGYFDFADSGNIIWSKTTNTSGVFYPSRDGFAWGNYHRDFTGIEQPDPLLYRHTNYFYVKHDTYDQPLNDPSYIDFDKGISIDNVFTLFFRISRQDTEANSPSYWYEKSLFTIGDNLYDELKLSLRKLTGNYQAVLDTRDIYGNGSQLLVDMEPEDSYIFVTYSGNLTAGTFNLYTGREYHTYSNTDSTGSIYPRYRVAAADIKAKLFGDDPFIGFVHEFGAKSFIDLETDSTFLYPIIRPTGTCLADDTFLYQKFPWGTGIITDSLSLQLMQDVLSEIPFQFIDPVSIRPSSIKHNICYEHITNHSGVNLAINTSWVSGYDSSWRTSSASIFLPSGNKQSITISPTSFSSGFSQETLFSDMTNFASCVFELTYDKNQDQPYDGEFKLYSFSTDIDVWAIAPTGVDDITLYTEGTYPTGKGYLDLFLLNKYGVDNLDLYEAGHLSVDEPLTLHTIAGFNQNNTSLFVYGNEDLYDGITLYTAHASGITSINDSYPSGLNLFVNGIFKEDAGLPLYITTKIPSSGNNGLDLFLWATDTGIGGIRSKHTLFINSENDKTKLLPLFIGGPDSLTTSDFISLYTQGPWTTEASGIPLFMARESEALDAAFSLFIKNNSKTSNIPLFVKSEAIAATDAQFILRDMVGGIQGVPYNLNYPHRSSDIPDVLNPITNKSVLFTGTEYIEGKDNRNILPSGDFTLSVWIKPTTDYLNENETILITEFDIDASGVVGCSIENTSFTADTWQHFIMYYDLSDTFLYSAYIDNVLVSTGFVSSYDEAITDIHNGVVFGRSIDSFIPGSGEANFEGNMTDARIYNRLITENDRMNLGSGIHISDGLVAHWLFNESNMLQLFIQSKITDQNRLKLYAHGF